MMMQWCVGNSQQLLGVFYIMRSALQELELRLRLRDKVGMIVKISDVIKVLFLSLSAMVKPGSEQYFRSMNISSMTMEVLK